MTPHELRKALTAKLDGKTKPIGSLGRLEALAMQVGLLQGTVSPTLRAPTMLVCAGDHGMARAGVSAYPQEVTAQMVANFLAGGAAISVLARQHGLALRVVNAGVAADFPPALAAHPGLIDRPVRGKAVPAAGRGTASAIDMPAMTLALAEAAVRLGREVAAQEIAAGSNCLLLGEMGIGNTASAALLMHAMTGLPLAQCVGRGTGLDDAGLARKLALLERAAARADAVGVACSRPPGGTHKSSADPASGTPQAAASGAPRAAQAMEVLRQFGGFEIGALVGIVLEAAERRAVVVVDGFIVTSAVLLAHAIRPDVLQACVFSHCSGEAGHRAMLTHLGVEPLLNLGLRLGEGSGAALAYPLLVSALALLNEMASFGSAGVSEAL
jgi:nicotinate-nucleotide--dimethylbenzimidazole phosphoribosyltransferase